MANARIIAVRLTPKASADRVGKMRKLPSGEEQLVVYVTAPPEDGAGAARCMKNALRDAGHRDQARLLPQRPQRRAKRFVGDRGRGGGVVLGFQRGGFLGGSLGGSLLPCRTHH